MFSTRAFRLLGVAAVGSVAVAPVRAAAADGKVAVTEVRVGRRDLGEPRVLAAVLEELFRRDGADVLSAELIRDIAGPDMARDPACRSPACTGKLESIGVRRVVSGRWAPEGDRCVLTLVLLHRGSAGWISATRRAAAACSPAGFAEAGRRAIAELAAAGKKEGKAGGDGAAAEAAAPRADDREALEFQGGPRSRDRGPDSPKLTESPPRAPPPAGSAQKAPNEEPRPAIPPSPEKSKDAPWTPVPPARERPKDGEKIEIRVHDPPPPPPRTPATAGLKAGAVDDNLQFAAFLRFVGENPIQGPRRDLTRRLIVTVRDKKGAPFANARVRVEQAGRTIVERKTYADGRALIFPSEHGGLSNARLVVQAGADVQTAPIAARHAIEVKMNAERPPAPTLPLDVAFLIDTTGSMGDEIERLKKTIEVIHLQIREHTPRPDVRFAMVLYRDDGDDYRTSVEPFTGDITRFRFALNEVEAGGGGDTPEDVQAALEDAMKKLAWRPDGIRLAFLIGDAPPHLDYGQSYTFINASADAARAGIKITAIGCSGLDRVAESVWRQIAQYTMAPFVFLTRGESGDVEGSASTVSHHVGSNWLSGNLDALIVKMVKRELSYFSERGAPKVEDYFEASSSQAVNAAGVLDDLFQQSVAQLADYSLTKIDERTPTMLLPVTSRAPALKPAAEKLDQRLSFALGRSRTFRLMERDQSKLDQALAAQFKPQFDENLMVEIGKRVPARLAVVSEVDGGAGQLQMLVRLVKLETGEVLSVSLLKIEEKLL